MQREIRRSILSGKVKAPPSGALAHRALFAASFADGHSVLSGVPDSTDVQATISACRAFGADIVTENEVADIFGNPGFSAPGRLDCGTSGTTLKMFMPLASLSDREVSFLGYGRLQGMNLEPFIAYLEKLGASCSFGASPGFLPFKIMGPRTADQMLYHPMFGSQFFSGLLMSCPLDARGTEIGIEQGFGWSEYVSGTLRIMKEARVQMSFLGDDAIYIEAPQAYSPLADFAVPKSRHLPSFPLLAGALCGKASVISAPKYPELEGLFSSFGAQFRLSDSDASVSTGAFSGARLDALKLGRLLPHALVLAAVSSGETVISNPSLAGKPMAEALRLMVRELSRMGAKITEEPTKITIQGGKLSGTEIDPGASPPAAMALSCAALAANGTSKIIGAECVDKIYPSFFRDLASLGAIVR